MRVIICIFSFVLPFLIHYQDAAAETPLIPVKVEPVLPENQRSETLRYFDLDVLPGETQTLQVKLTNANENDVTVHIKATNAYTHPSGGIIYEPATESPNYKLTEQAVELKDYIALEETSMPIPAKATAELTLQVKAPPLEGQTALGGLQFITESKESEQPQAIEEGTARFQVKTELIVAIAVQLNFPNTVAADFSFGEVAFRGESADILVEMANNAQRIQRNVQGAYTIQKEDTEMFSGIFGPFTMAPTSEIKYPLRWEHEELENGDYSITITATIDGEEVTTTNSFTINHDDIQDYIEKNDPIVTQNKNNMIWYVVIAAILFGIAMFFLGKKRKRS